MSWGPRCPVAATKAYRGSPRFPRTSCRTCNVAVPGNPLPSEQAKGLCTTAGVREPQLCNLPNLGEM